VLEFFGGPREGSLKPMPLNFREGMRRLGIVAGGLGAFAGAIGGSLVAIDAHASAARGLLGEPVWVDYTVAALLPFTGFLILWGPIRVLVWIWGGIFRAAYRTRAGKATGR
jgi:hypothetical protein